MSNLGKYITGYFLVYGIISFINNMALDIAKRQGSTVSAGVGHKTPIKNAHNHRGYM